ncbi:hypothetical protein BDV93DRAFT_529680 [Ceratobasidium sp. AG-I]|nr:hypothetical protein BDV93DRAFT_529680 [Ceratobasidium sp. AG-I]
MTSPLSLPNKLTQSGTHFTDPTSERYQFPAEIISRPSQVTSARALRVLDAFVLLKHGRKAVLPPGWHESQNWHDISIIGAVASLYGEDTLMSQSGRFDKICWRWMRLDKLIAFEIGTDPRFRKSEPCLWLRTVIGDYAMLQPHKGYLQEWLLCTTGVKDFEKIPEPRRYDPEGPMPAWWDVDAVRPWSDNTANRIAEQPKRCARGSSEVEDEPENEAVDVHEVASHSVGGTGGAVPASNVREPSDLTNILQDVWDLESDKAPALQKEYPPAKIRDTSQRGSKRTRRI